MIRPSPSALLLALAAPSALAAQTPVQQMTVQPIPGSTDADRLADQMRRLAVSPNDLDALLTAGELSLKLDDLGAAASFFTRAERVDPRNGRARAGQGAILVHAERPGEALRYFAQAEQLGRAPATFAAERGLAYDLIGENDRAQRDYRVALRAASDDETLRRYALSLGIAGKREIAEQQLQPLLRKSDRGAWRARAFIEAMSGNGGEASRIATTMMPPGTAAGLQPFFERLPSLPAADRAFAVHFGNMRSSPQRIADARLAPAMAALAPDPTAPRLASAQPVAVAAADRGGKRKRGRKDEPVQLAAVQPTARPAPAPLPDAPAYVAQPGTPPVLAQRGQAPASWPTTGQPSAAPIPFATIERSNRRRHRDESAALANAQAAMTRRPGVTTASAIRPGVTSTSVMPLGAGATPAARQGVTLASAAPPAGAIVARPSSAAVTGSTPTRVAAPPPAERDVRIAAAPVLGGAAAAPAEGGVRVAVTPVASAAPVTATPERDRRVASTPAAGSSAASAPGFSAAVAPGGSLAAWTGITPASSAAVPATGAAPLSASATGAAPPSLAPSTGATSAPADLLPPSIVPAAAPPVALAASPAGDEPAADRGPPTASDSTAMAVAQPVEAPPAAVELEAQPVTAAPPPVSLASRRAGGTALASIMNGLPIPGSELGIVAPRRAAPPAAKPDEAAAEPKPAERNSVRHSAAVAPVAATLDETKPADRRANRRATAEPAVATAEEAKPTERRAGRRAATELATTSSDEAKPTDRRAGRRNADKAADAKPADSDDDSAKALADKRAADRKAAADKKKLADAKAAAAKKAEEDREAAVQKKLERANPERIWVQVAGGAYAGDLPKAWAAAKTQGGDAYAGQTTGYTTPLRFTNRVLAGPFKTDAEARAFVNRLKTKGIGAFTFTSKAGQPVAKLPAK